MAHPDPRPELSTVSRSLAVFLLTKDKNKREVPGQNRPERRSWDTGTLRSVRCLEPYHTPVRRRHQRPLAVAYRRISAFGPVCPLRTGNLSNVSRLPVEVIW